MNDYKKFKGRGRLRTEIAVVIVLAIAILLVFLFPKFERESKMEAETKIIFIKSIDVPQVDLAERSIPAPRPAIPIISEDEDFDISITLDDMEFDSYSENVPPPPKDPNEEARPDTFYVFDEAPKVIGSIADNIIYPEIAREAGIEGNVIVQSFIDDKGIVQECIILKGMPGTGLDEAAINAIKKTKYIPAQQRDKSVGVWIAIPVSFKLNK